MTGNLSQEEIDELLRRQGQAGEEAEQPDDEGDLSLEERDAIGEIGNISMANSATALSALLGHPVSITTPKVEVMTESEVRQEYQAPAAIVTVHYTEGLDGRNVFVIALPDAGVVADLMMGGAGAPADGGLTEVQISAVAEAMNQMVGAAATAMAEMLGRRVDISAPEVERLTLSAEDVDLGGSRLVRVSFDLAVGDVLETTLMQLMPLSFARELIAGLTSAAADDVGVDPEPPPPPPPLPEEALASEAMAAATAAPVPEAVASERAADDSHLRAVPTAVAQPAAFPSLDGGAGAPVQGDIGLLLDVPLQVTVELGRTQLRIRNVLELVPGSIVELDKLSGEPVDVLVNGKPIAKGEVVVIDEEFGVRITDIASQARRLRGLAE